VAADGGPVGQESAFQSQRLFAELDQLAGGVLIAAFHVSDATFAVADTPGKLFLSQFSGISIFP
jgi:hypothetical protein